MNTTLITAEEARQKLIYAALGTIEPEGYTSEGYPLYDAEKVHALGRAMAGADK